MQTQGISPKLVAAIIAATVTYLLTQTVLELPAGIVLALQVASVAVAVYRAGPGDVTYDAIPGGGEPPS